MSSKKAMRVAKVVDWQADKERSAGVRQKGNLFEPDTFLTTIDMGRRSLRVSSKQTIYAQGTASDAVFYVQKGNVKLNVLSPSGKEATIGIYRCRDFFGEGCLAGQLLRMGSASAITDCELLRIDKNAMMQALHQKRTLSDMFVAYLLARNIRYEEDLTDQLFNSCEKRLARILLLLAHFGMDGVPDRIVPEISQTTLAEMVGTTRSRVNFFMNRFRKLGLIHYNGGLQVRSSLLNVVLHDCSYSSDLQSASRG
jgi:CRP/FNR family cyclic AMP-dependent transcriptional regulator